ncbi:AMP-binding domain-containing protein [Aphelenchoides bicaudatus]|nr:AMP-binding domain-containing protein [Aphelenchoides bicaudatus]
MTPKVYRWTNNEFEQVGTDVYEQSFAKLLQQFNGDNSLIGLCFEKSAKLAVLMQSVCQSGNAFCWLDPRADTLFTKNRCLKMRVKVIFAENQLEWPSTSWTSNEESGVWFNLLPFADNLDVFGTQFIYAICTSATTGQPKSVIVPPSAIMPNVYDFIERFDLNSKSKLMWSTSLQFDPSFLELLLAFETGCSLYIVDEVDLKRIWQFGTMIKKAEPSFLQITPAVLSLFSNEFLSELFGSKSPVKNLLIGGDTFPVAFIKRHSQQCSSQIFNVYGLTEVSCWASCTRFNPETDQFADTSDTIQDTRLRFSTDGVEIHGRGCVVDGEMRKSILTGDQFIEVNENGQTKYVITSREKINGEIVSREVEEYLLKAFHFVRAARLVTYNEQLFIFIQKIDGSEDGLVEIPEKFRIKSIFYIDQFPITVNGKIDDTALRLQIQQDIQTRDFTGTVFDYLQKNLDLRNSDSTTIASLGFSSRDLFEFIFEVQQRQQIKDKELETLRQKLFDEQTKVDFLFDLISKCQNGELKQLDNYVDLKMETCSFSVVLDKKLPMKKCVDFSAEFYDSMIFVGDMSGYFAVFDIMTGQLIFEQQHEAAVIVKPLIHFGCVIYCTVDGQVHWIELKTWKIRSAEVGDSIRAEPCPFDERNLIVATFSSHVILLDLQSGEFEEICSLSNGLIRNTPLVCKDFVIVSTLDGTIGCFQRNALTKIEWTHHLKESLFVPLIELARYESICRPRIEWNALFYVNK